MLRFVPRFAAVLLVVLAGALAPAAAEERAFQASGEGDVLGSLMYGSGEATHLGRSRLFVDLWREPSAGYFAPAFPSASLYSANGDVLTFDFDAWYYPIASDTGVVSATLTFTGGTGRFQDATGSADVMMVFDLHTAYETCTFLIDGSIDY